MTVKNLDILNAYNKTMFSHFKQVLIFMVLSQSLLSSADHILIGGCNAKIFHSMKKIPQSFQTEKVETMGRQSNTVLAIFLSSQS